MKVLGKPLRYDEDMNLLCINQSGTRPARILLNL
jgi:hypothetical protein